ncbi:MAG: GAF domain-containing protein [Xenococcaceae cyanobacterium MO_188.B32]|nr:GAF domain-containing protein [Xenococcaceae cyanobacterium MO_188.B32]
MTTLFNSPNANINSSNSTFSNGASSKSYLTQQIKDALRSLVKDLEQNDSQDSHQFRDRLTEIVNLTNEVERQENIEQQKSSAIAEQLRLAEDTETLLNQAVTLLSQLLDVERVLVYTFNTENKGIVAAEALQEGFTPAIGEKIAPLCFGLANANHYQQVKVVAIADVEQGELSPYQLQLMERFQVKASLAIPILLSGKVWGLLVTQQCLRTRQWQESEIRLLEQVSAELAVQLQIAEVKVELQGELNTQKALARVLDKIRQPSFNLDTIFRVATQEVRKLIKVERVTIYKFREDYFGDFVAEAELPGFPKLVGSGWEDPYLQEHQGGMFREDKVLVCDDIYKADLTDCHVEALELYGVKSCAVVAIFKGQELWGLLSAFQNTSTRHWSESEVQLLRRVAAQIGVALIQKEAFAQVQAKNDRLTKVAEREKASVNIIKRIRQTLDLETTMRTTTKELRSLLNCDRVAIYKFNPDWSGSFVAESVGSGWVSLMEQQEKLPTLKESVSDCQGIQGMANNASAFSDTYLQENQGGSFRDRQLMVRDDIYKAGFSPCYLEVLEEYQARAYTLVPVFVGEKLWGLLAAFQNTGPHHWEEGEINLLVLVATQLGVALQQVNYVKELHQQSEQISRLAERSVAAAKIIYQLGQQSPAQLQDSSSLQPILRLATTETRKLFDTDRVAIYQFNPDWSGDFIVEDVGKDWTPLVGTPLQRTADTYLQENQGGRYAQKESLRVDNIYTQGYQDCHIQLLEQFEAKAYMLAPIFNGEQLWGLLAAYHNAEPRSWEDSELRLLTQVASQIGVVIQRMEDIQELASQRQKLTEAAEREKTDKERLQREALSLLRAVEPSLQGDLTVQAPLWEDEVGTIADGYNTTLQTLRELVRQVKSSAEKVGQTCSNSTIAVSQLSNQAQQQSQDLTQALKKLQQMVELIAEVSINAQQVDRAVLEANQTVRAGDSVMEETVAGIAEIRETVAETAKKLKILGESSQKIVKVVNLIDNFANQTNLLAINAAIEATRAGEYGRGFAVVADEIRTLAYQSANAGTEIERLVEEIRTETQSVTEAMELGIMRVVKGTELVNKTRHSLDEIKSATKQISDRVQQITVSTSTQTKQSQLMTKAMTDVADIANQTSETSVKIASLFEELLVTSEQLQTSISKFKID